MAAPEHKYTDRDVREDESLKELAIEYLETYGGSFEPVLDAQKAWDRDGYLNTVTVRTVLNCMRNDNSVSASLPEPKHPYIQPAIRRLKSVSTYKETITKMCENTESHYPHTIYPNKVMKHCPGIPWLINRERFVGTRATFKRPFVMSRTGKMVHYIFPDHEKNLITWRNADMHEYGQAKPFSWQVKLLCRYPSIVTKGILLSETEANQVIASFSDIEMCPKCICEMGS